MVNPDSRDSAYHGQAPEDYAPKRTAKGTFAKGYSGNVGGRPKPALRDALRRYLQERPDVADRLVDRAVKLALGEIQIARGEQASPDVLRWIVDQVDGKLTDKLQHSWPEKTITLHGEAAHPVLEARSKNGQGKREGP